MYWFLHGLARFLRLWPEGALDFLCRVIGAGYFYLDRSRRRHLLSQLAHAYPEFSESELRQAARVGCARMVEMGLFSVVCAHVSGDWVRQRLKISSGDLENYRQVVESGPALALVPHMCLIEMMTLGREVGFPVDQTAVLYRAFGSPGLERFVRQGRERFGLRPVARKRGLIEAGHCLRRGGRVVLLFDQSSGPSGEMMPFLGRLASTTTLPDVFGRRFPLGVVFVWIQRTGFWRGSLHVDALGNTPELSSPIAAANARLEKLYREDITFATDWLWLHRRWKEGLRAEKIFTPVSESGWAGDVALGEDPRATRCVVLLPEKVEAARKILSRLHELRAARPDFQMTLLGREEILNALRTEWPEVERQVVLPLGAARWRVLRREAKRYPAIGVAFPERGARRIEMMALGVLIRHIESP